MNFTNKDIITVAAHRGDSYNYYENTMTAFKMAISKGVHMIETDIHLTLDEKLVLIHDDTVDRTSNGKGRVSEMTLEQLRALNVGDGASYEQIPTLGELFDLVKDTDVTLNLEIKEYFSCGNEQRCDLCIDKTIELILEYGMEERCLINSFDAYVLEYVYKKHGKRFALHGFFPYSIMGNVSLNPDEYLYCACIFDNENKSLYSYLTERGIEPWIGAGVTQESKLKICIENGAKLITTNNPKDIFDKMESIKNGLQ